MVQVALLDQADHQVRAVLVVLQVAPVLVVHLDLLAQVEKMAHQGSLQLLELLVVQDQMAPLEMQETQANRVLQVLVDQVVQQVQVVYPNHQVHQVLLVPADRQAHLV